MTNQLNEERSPVRVLHIVSRMESGGAEVRLLELISRVNPQEFCVDVLAHSGLSGVLDSRVKAHGGRVIHVPLKSPWFPLRFIRLLRRARYGVVQSHSLYTSGLFLCLAALAGVPIRIAHIHNTHDGRRATWRRRAQRSLMNRLIDRYATNIIACGEGAMEAIWGARWRTDPRCEVVYDALDLERFGQPIDREAVRAGLGIPASARVFVHLGRQAPAKNHRRLLAIFAEIQKVAPDSRLILAGSGTDDPEGETVRGARELGIEDRVMALGLRQDIPQLLKAADAFLLPSLWEGLPGVVLEACAAGVPVLASDLPGVLEIATRLPLVRHLSLSASDREWAQAALALPIEAEGMNLRSRAAELIRASVFHVDRAAESHREMWLGVAEKTERRALACS